MLQINCCIFHSGLEGDFNSWMESLLLFLTVRRSQPESVTESCKKEDRDCCKEDKCCNEDQCCKDSQGEEVRFLKISIIMKMSLNHE